MSSKQTSGLDVLDSWILVLLWQNRTNVDLMEYNSLGEKLSVLSGEEKDDYKVGWFKFDWKSYYDHLADLERNSLINTKIIEDISFAPKRVIELTFEGEEVAYNKNKEIEIARARQIIGQQIQYLLSLEKSFMNDKTHILNTISDAEKYIKKLNNPDNFYDERLIK